MNNIFMNINIRLAVLEDIPSISKCFTYAKNKMRGDGNMNQWALGYPISETPLDIAKKQCYVVTSDNKVVATFVLINDEPTYRSINGAWLNDRAYYAIHRIASNGEIKNIFNIVLDYLKPLGRDIRIDTHIDNKRMIHILEKNGFKYCGIIKLANGDDRNAYQLINE